MDAQAPQSVPASRPVQQPQPLPVVQLAAKANLFAEAQRPTAMPSHVPNATEPARPSLFNTVTGAFRRRALQPAPTTASQPAPRREPEIAEYQAQNPNVSVRQTSAGDETGIEIPAFLRRQHS
jgi:cell division protein FtsZ